MCLKIHININPKYYTILMTVYQSSYEQAHLNVH